MEEDTIMMVNTEKFEQIVKKVYLDGVTQSIELLLSMKLIDIDPDGYAEKFVKDFIAGYEGGSI